LTERYTIFDVVVEYHQMRYNTSCVLDEYFDSYECVQTDVLVALVSRLSLSVLDRGDAIVNDDSKAAVSMERKRIMFSSGYQSLGSDNKRV
jgi:hypothetical protein